LDIKVKHYKKKKVSLTIICVFGFLVWCVGFFMAQCWVLLVGLKRMSRSKTMAMLSISFLSRFSDNTYWYSLVLLIRRFLFGIVPSLSFEGVPAGEGRLWALVFMVVISIVVNHWLRPYRFHAFDVIDNGSLYILLIVLAGSGISASLDTMVFVVAILGFLPLLYIIGRAALSYKRARGSMVRHGGAGKQVVATPSDMPPNPPSKKTVMQTRESAAVRSVVKAMFSGDQQARVFSGSKLIRDNNPDTNTEWLVTQMSDDMYSALTLIVGELALSDDFVHLGHLMGHAREGELKALAAAEGENAAAAEGENVILEA
jgi:hypothetical protein